jgi:hypothetical protein
MAPVAARLYMSMHPDHRIACEPGVATTQNCKLGGKPLPPACKVLHSRDFHTLEMDAKYVDAIKRFWQLSPNS